MQLPDWASQTGGGDVPAVEVDTHAAYPAILAEYRALYAGDPPPEWLTKDGDLRKEWADALDDLQQPDDEVSAYWLEVAYQTVKLDIVMAARSFRLALRFRDEGRLFCQDGRAEGRGVKRAAGGPNGGREAREHYRRLRGFLPA